MQLRKLEKQEYKTTRALWESVFAEDTKAFLDYYYAVKTRDNAIYVIDEDEKIRAMLQLNPYRMQMEDRKCMTHYIIAVATEEAYRGRGMMRRLLLESMQDMYRKKEPFTFLMPAAEAIYTPYDFRYIYKQLQMSLTGVQNVQRTSAKEQLLVKEAQTEDAGKLASFARKILSGNYQVYAVRNKAYYETMIAEQKSENGGVKMVYAGRKLVGIFAYAREEGFEIREPLFLSEYEMLLSGAVYELTGDKKTEVQCIGCETHNKAIKDLATNNHSFMVKQFVYKPMIMARILHLETLLKLLKTMDDQPFSCSFAMIDPLLAQNNRILRVEYQTEEKEMTVCDTEDSDGVFTIDSFTSVIFGYRTLEEIEQDDGVILTEKLKSEFAKLRLLNKIFLNEIV